MTWNYNPITREELYKEQLSLEQLESIRDFLLDKLSNESARQKYVDSMETVVFHKFKQGLMNIEMLQEVSKEACGVELVHPAQLDINIAMIGNDMKDETHYHNQTLASVVVLGEEHGFNNPINTFVHQESGEEDWIEVSAGDTFAFQEMEKHGFTSEGGETTFLTVQSLAINTDRFGLESDYHH